MARGSTELEGQVASRRSDSRDELPDYYIAPTHDFTQYTRDYEQKYWSKDTAFDWRQNVPDNLARHVLSLSAAELARLAELALPLVKGGLRRRIAEIRGEGLPVDEDAIRALAEGLPSEGSSVDRAAEVLRPLAELREPAARLRDRLTILEREQFDLSEQRRLRLFKTGTTIRRLESDGERREQAEQLASLEQRIADVRRQRKRAAEESRAQRARLAPEIRKVLEALRPAVLAELQQSLELVESTLRYGVLPRAKRRSLRLRELVWKRQVRGLKDICNHALVVEQSAIAPLTMGIIHYRRRREIQEAMTTFVNDEAKHSAVFRRFLADKLDAKERVSASVIKGSQRYMWLAKVTPGAGMYLAVIVESIGGAFLEYFSRSAHMPEPLFRSICDTISNRDEKRHVDLCVATYNELYRKGGWWEGLRNRVALRTLMKAAYGDKTEDHVLLQACRAFGMEPDVLYRHICGRLSEHLLRVGTRIEPEEILAFMQLRQSASGRPHLAAAPHDEDDEDADQRREEAPHGYERGVKEELRSHE
jgi:hypothetical protein